MATDTTTGVSFAGEITLNQCNLINTTETTSLDIRALILEINLYEDVFSNLMSGSVTITEDFNLISAFPILGEELLSIEFSSAAFDSSINTINKLFYVYKVGRHEVTNGKNNVYVLYFSSQEMLLDINRKTSRSYFGYTHDIVKNIFDSSFGKYTVSPLKIEETSSKIKFVSNYWTPFRSIAYATKRSTRIDEFKTPNFLFFENGKGFVFSSLSSLYSSQPKTQYYYNDDQLRITNDSGESVRDIPTEFRTAKKLHIDKKVDFLERVNEGSYGARMYEFDILNKTYNVHQYDYFYDFDRSKHLSDYPVCSNKAVFDSFGKIGTSVAMPFVHDQISTDISPVTRLKRKALITQTDMVRIEIEVPGRPDVQAGDTVLFNMLDYSQSDETDMSKSKLDQYYSGKYMVSAIMHRITMTRHEMVLQLVKDSFANKIELPKEIT